MVVNSKNFLIQLADWILDWFSTNKLTWLFIAALKAKAAMLLLSVGRLAITSRLLLATALAAFPVLVRWLEPAECCDGKSYIPLDVDEIPLRLERRHISIACMLCLTLQGSNNCIISFVPALCRNIKKIVIYNAAKTVHLPNIKIFMNTANLKASI